MTTPTPPAAAPTPRTDAVNECAKRLILNRPFGSSTADLLQELADLYSKHAESLERFLGSALANNDPLREKVIEFQRELAAKDARIAALKAEVEQYRKDIGGLLEECSKHISLSNDFPWSEEIHCAFRHLETEIERLSKAKHTNAANFLYAEAAKADLTAARALNDTLAGALKRSRDAIGAGFGKEQRAHIEQQADAALSAYAKSKKAAK